MIHYRYNYTKLASTGSAPGYVKYTAMIIKFSSRLLLTINIIDIILFDGYYLLYEHYFIADH